MGDGDPAELANTEAAVEPTLSPDGGSVSFVRDGNLHVLDRESGELTRPTNEAEDGLTLGLADYIAQEEFGQLRGHWWSRDAQQIALVRVDSRHIPEYPIVHQGMDRPEVERHRYPFSGAANATVQLGVVPAAGGPIRWLELPDEDGYLVRVAWWPQPGAPAGRLVAQWLNRKQDRLRLIAFGADGAAETLIDEQQSPWINIGDEARGLDDGRFLWASEASGFRHLSLRSDDGALVRTLTAGEWMVTDLVGVDEARGLLYFGATRESPLQRHVYRVPLDGGDPERLTDPGGVHGGVLSRDGEWLATIGSSLQTRPVRPRAAHRWLSGDNAVRAARRHRAITGPRAAAASDLPRRRWLRPLRRALPSVRIVRRRPGAAARRRLRRAACPDRVRRVGADRRHARAIPRAAGLPRAQA